MRYFGGKYKIAKYIVEVLNEYRKDNQPFVEPFRGVCNIASKMNGIRYCSDINEYLIAMFEAIRGGWLPPQNMSKSEYEYIKSHKDEDKALTGFAGFGCSFAGKWFGGYAKDNRGDNYCLQAYNSLLRQRDSIKDIVFECRDYRSVNVKNCLIYCDPPYRNTTQYSGFPKFNSDKFWEVMRSWSQHNTVIISEYTAPDDFKCIKSIHTKTEIRNKQNIREDRTEKLFMLK